jgi:hypothetical protein
VSLLALAVIGACGRKRGTSRTGPPRQLKKSDMTAAEVKYGIAPTPDPSVTYQPNVVLVGGGADAIRALSSTGLTWTIDASAPHAGELAEGKIIFLTNRAVGRVLDVRKDGGNLAVTLGPVLITDVIRDCDIDYGPIPIDFGEAIPYEVADLPGRVIPAKGSAELWPSGGLDPIVRNVGYTVQDGAPGSAPPAASPAPQSDVSSLVHFKLVPTASSKGFGVRGTSDGGGLKMMLEAYVHLDHPMVTPKLKIANGDLREATVELSGAAGLTMGFSAETDVGMSANVNGRIQAVPDFSVPLPGPMPLAVTIRQQILVDTALGVRNAKLSAEGDYTFRGSFKIGYDGHRWGLFGPSGFTQKQTILASSQGIAMSASGLNLSHQMKVVAGIGAWGLATGPYFALNSAVGLFKGSDAGWIQCKESTLVVGMSGGIGYLIPKPITDVINFILGTLHIRYRVDSFGGVESKPMTIINKTSTLPGCKADKG